MKTRFLVPLLLWFAVGCAPTGGGADTVRAEASARVTGTLTFRERVMLRPGSVAEVWLLDTTRADVRATELAHRVIDDPGSPPIPFELEYDPAEVDPRRSYSVRAVIRRGDQLLFTSDTHHPVLTRGADDRVEVSLVKPARAARTPDAPLRNTYWKLVSIRGEAYVHTTDSREPHLKFLAEDERISGFSGCNSFTGSFRAGEGELALGPLAATRRACLQGMDTEAAFLQALEEVDGYRIRGETLQLLDRDTVVLGFGAVYF